MKLLKDMLTKNEIVKEIFARKEFDIKGYKLKFVKAENAWHVLKGHAIMYIGEESACRTYLNGLSPLNP